MLQLVDPVLLTRLPRLSSVEEDMSSPALDVPGWGDTQRCSPFSEVKVKGVGRGYLKKGWEERGADIGM